MPLLRSTDIEIAYGRTSSDRMKGGLVGAVMLALTTVLLVMVESTLPRSAEHSPLEFLPSIAFGGLFEMVGLCLFICFQFTEDVILDLPTRIYRVRSGLPLIARWHSGPFSDIDDIVLRKVATKQGAAYRIALTWRGKAPGILRRTLRDVRDIIVDSLDNSGQRPRSEVVAEMEMVAKRLELPGVTGHDEAPELVRQRSIRMTAFCTTVAVLISCALFGSQALLASQLDRQGRTTTGVVTNMRRASKSTVLEFTYEVNGLTHGSHENVNADTFEKVQIEDNITVTYLPDYPDTCRTTYSVASTSQSVGSLVFAAGGSLIFGVCYGLYRSRRQTDETSRSNR